MHGVYSSVWKALLWREFYLHTISPLRDPFRRRDACRAEQQRSTWDSDTRPAGPQCRGYPCTHLDACSLALPLSLKVTPFLHLAQIFPRGSNVERQGTRSLFLSHSSSPFPFLDVAPPTTGPHFSLLLSFSRFRSLWLDGPKEACDATAAGGAARMRPLRL